MSGKPVAVCFRHPTRTAKRKCYTCRRPICPKCQDRLEGHIFCSHRCARTMVRRERWERLLRWNRTALTGPWFRFTFYAAFLSVALALAVLFMNLQWFVPWPSGNAALHPVAAGPELRKEAAMPDWDSPGVLRIDSPIPGAAFGENLISVEGVAPFEAMVGLYVNDRKVSVQMTLDGKWRFTKVPLIEKTNVVQARYFDNSGDSAFSKAILVHLRALPAPPPLSAPAVPNVAVASRLNLIRAPRGNRQVLLTFDGGSSANATPMILDALRSKGIRSTIFLTGEYIRRYPELVRRMVEDGHIVGNHSMSHPHLTSYSFDARQRTLTGVSRGFLQDQLRRANSLFRETTGMDFKPFWRAPFGEYNSQILGWAGELGYRHVYWSPHLDTLDWVADRESPLYRGPEQILRKILKRADVARDGIDGGIILMHLGTERPGEQSAHTILDTMTSQLDDRGYSFTDVEQAWPLAGGGEPVPVEAPE